VQPSDGGAPGPTGAEYPVYNTQAVVQLTAVPAPTFRAWERRYGVPRPARLPGGQRLYSEHDVALIRWLHDRTAEGMTISRALRLLEARRADPVPQPPVAPRSFAQLQGELLERLLAFDTPDAERVMGEAFALYPVEDVCLQLLQPVLVEIGERWHQGTVSVAAEHFASNLIRRKLCALLQVYDSPGRGRPVLLGCAAEELHEIGLLLVALFLSRRGWPVIYLGPAVPPDDLREAVTRLQPRLVVLSASSDETARTLGETARLLAALPEPRPLLGYGGRVYEQNGASAGPPPAGTYLGPDARAAAQQIDALLGGRPT
jgi:MerR family transcriptional regulator, light-induced transcriptional regulator